MDRTPKLNYPCPVCCGIFTEFIIFEGHLEFSRNCRENIGSYVQCYVCREEFKNLAVLKYHLEFRQQDCHSIRQKKNFGGADFINENISLELGKEDCGVAVDSDVCRNRLNVVTPVSEHLRKNRMKIRGNVKQKDFSLTGKRIYGRVHQCELCEAKFGILTNLKRHMPVHTFGTIACGTCKVMFTRNTFIQHQKTFHSNGIQKVFKHRRRIYQCYVCKIGVSTLDDLSNHMDKHSVFQQWIDPSNTILSNWSPEESQEILQNQPLVLVEKLKIDRINLLSLGDFMRRSLGYEAVVPFVLGNIKLEENWSEYYTNGSGDGIFHRK